MTAGDGRVLRLKRILPGARAIVYRALSDPEELAKWWGPRGFTTPSVEFDPRVGGGYRIAMQPPDGDLFYLSGEFREVDPPGPSGVHVSVVSPRSGRSADGSHAVSPGSR